jgi:dipeptidase
MCKNWKTVSKGDTLVSPLANPWLTTETRTTLNTIAPGTIDFVRTVAVCWCSYSTVIQLRASLPDAVGGILWYGVDNPGQSPRIPIFCGGKKLPKAFDNCGQKQYVPDCILWQFRRPNRLGTVAWQQNKGLFEKQILQTEDIAIEAVNLLGDTQDTDRLDACTALIYNDCAARWNDLEQQLWMKHGRGF